MDRVIPDEPVRGRTPPPWYYALTGLDRMRAYARGQLPSPPLARLLGFRTTHVVPGGVTLAMPATEASLSGNGQLAIVPFIVAALRAASDTAVAAGMMHVPLKFGMDPFRPVWVRPGNLLARARVVNSGNLFVFTEVQVEDPEGRHIAQGNMQAAFEAVEPPPPAPPKTMRPVEEPVYETADPYLRSFAVTPMEDVMRRVDGLTMLAEWGAGRLKIPNAELYGVRLLEHAEGRACLSIPASEWFSVLGPTVSVNVIAGLADMTCWCAAISLHQSQHTVVVLDGVTRFLRAARADGRLLHGESVLSELAPNLFVADTKIRNADGDLIAVQTGSVKRLDASQRERRHRRESTRVLATLLFTDIVGSTQHAERLGDARWQTLLEEHKLAVRRELSRYNGAEVDTAGDGFFVRFESPARAIGAALSAVRATARLGIEIRAGIHTGECELQGNQPAGMAVHIASRIQGTAQPGEVLVSSTVKDLAVGSGVRFSDRGEQALKGVPDPWRLYVVVDG